MSRKEYKLPNGKKAVFEYDITGAGKITLECMDELMGMITDRPQGYWTKTDVATYRCSECGKIQIADDVNELNFCCCCGSRNKMRIEERERADKERRLDRTLLDIQQDLFELECRVEQLERKESE